ncbi:hypothetical protein CsatB_016817 [Cannabis sativa]
MLRCMCVDQSTIWMASLSWSVFVLFTIVVPGISHFVLACSTCDSKHDSHTAQGGRVGPTFNQNISTCLI